MHDKTQSHTDLSGVPRRDVIRALAAAPLTALLTTAACKGEKEAMAPNRPNILLVHCHDLGQFLHCYGVATVQTPHLDRFATEGVRFANSYCTAPQCSPSRASLFTGRYPHANGVMGLAHKQFAWDLHPEERHLGQYLLDAGYTTAGTGILHETRSGPERCGLQRYENRVRAAPATDDAIEFLQGFAEDRSKPFYLQVGYLEPHRLPPARAEDVLGFLGKDLSEDRTLGVDVPGYLRDTEGTRTELAELQGAVHHVDAQFGRLTAALDDLGLTEDTLVIFTTDHGIAMPRAKCSLYDPGIQVAFMLRYPGRDGWHGGVTHAPVIQNVEYVPTILELLGIPAPDNLHGRSLAPLLAGDAYAGRDELFAEITYHDYYDPRRCIRTDAHKLIVNFSTSYSFMDPSQSWRPRADTVEPPNHALAYHELLELYDLKNDPWELKNIAGKDSQQDVVAHLLQRLHAHLASTNDPILQGAVMNPMHRRALDALGQRG